MHQNPRWEIFQMTEMRALLRGTTENVAVHDLSPRCVRASLTVWAGRISCGESAARYDTTADGSWAPSSSGGSASGSSLSNGLIRLNVRMWYQGLARAASVWSA
jgi:hypothetical protein